MSKIVEIAVEKVKYHFDFLYSYKVPANLENNILLGSRVVIPFGRSNLQRQGIIFNIYDNDSTDKNIKEIYTVIDKEQMIDEDMLNLAKYMKKIYYCTLFEAAKMMVPSAGNLKVYPVLAINENIYKTEKEKLSFKEQEFVEYLLKSKKFLKGKLFAELETKYFEILDKLKTFKVIDINYRIFKNSREKSSLPVQVIEGDCIKNKLTEKQKVVINFAKNYGALTVKEICYFTGISQGIVNNLIKKGMLEHINLKPQEKIQTDCYKKQSSQINLTDLQNKIFNELKEIRDKKEYKVSFIYGVTGSGKTMVMMSLINYVLKDDKSVIFMVPEIVLTTQLVLLFKSHYGEKVAVLHSGLPNKERENEWKRIKEGKARVIVGTRTAAFAPVQNLGLIIMDEEHEYTYKSECSPRFHARDIAKYRCKQNNCMLVLASATPSVESYFLTELGIYSLHKMNKRYGKACIPKTEIIDMNSEMMEGNPTPFSKRLVEVINEEISQERQVILLINRRGYNTFVRCRECRETITCPNCNITLNYHKDNNRLMCHYCGYSVEILKECPKCHGFNIEYNGTGTQRAEFQLQQLIPSARILRVDSDSMENKRSREGLFDLFFKRKYDIMIGTQMISKGLNFSNVTLVGVLSADQALYSDDFRSYERAFSLITQVVGRSGRGNFEGKALIQTYTPENPVIKLAAEQNYELFYKEEIKIRREMLYPPFADLCIVVFIGKKEKMVLKCCEDFFENFKSMAQNKYADIPLKIFRPSVASVNKVCGNYRFKIVVKCRNNNKFRDMMSKLMLLYEKDLNKKGIGIFIDINPEFIL